jgi:hypothetical protein
MKSQKLKAFEDFLKRAEIIPETLLLITKNNSICDNAITELVQINYEIPFYELNLSDHPNLESELSNYYDENRLPAFVYFRGTHMVSKKDGLEKDYDLSEFLVHSKSQAS